MPQSETDLPTEVNPTEAVQGTSNLFGSLLWHSRPSSFDFSNCSLPNPRRRRCLTYEPPSEFSHR
jgi:hypothetical protein